MEADWAGLHTDLLILIVEKIKCIQDFVLFGAVCKSWQDAANNNKKYLRRQTPWLLLAEREEDVSRREIYSLSDEKLFSKKLYLPEAVGKKCIGLDFGWILTISPSGDMNLLHPLTRSQIHLPHQTSITEYEIYDTDPPYLFISKAALSGNPSDSSDFVLMIIHSSSGKYLGYWRLGDKCWTRIEADSKNKLWFTDLIYHQDHFYAFTTLGYVCACKVSGVYDSIKLNLIAHLDDDLPWVSRIVGSDGALLVLDRVAFAVTPTVNGEFYVREKIKIMELDLAKGGWKEIKSLGDKAIFLGHNTTVCYDNVSDFPGIKSNHIYFTDDFELPYVSQKKDGGGDEMGFYSLEDDNTEDESFKKFDVGESLSLICPPFWYIPSF